MDRAGWPGLFASAFNQSRNAMVLVDAERYVVDVNPAFARLVGRARGAIVGHPVYQLLAHGPLATPREWRDTLVRRRFTGEATLRHADGSEVPVQWGATTEVVTGRRLVLFVTLGTSRWGGRFRRPRASGRPRRTLSAREREVVRLVALGESGPEIAAELGIAHDTVRTHVRNAMRKLNARSRAHLVALSLGDGLLEP